MFQPISRALLQFQQSLQAHPCSPQPSEETFQKDHDQGGREVEGCVLRRIQIPPISGDIMGLEMSIPNCHQSGGSVVEHDIADLFYSQANSVPIS